MKARYASLFSSNDGVQFNCVRSRQVGGMKCLSRLGAVFVVQAIHSKSGVMWRASG